MTTPLRILVELYIEPKTDYEYDITRTELLIDLSDVLKDATKNHDSIPWEIVHVRIKPKPLEDMQ